MFRRTACPGLVMSLRDCGERDLLASSEAYGAVTRSSVSALAFVADAAGVPGRLCAPVRGLLQFGSQRRDLTFPAMARCTAAPLAARSSAWARASAATLHLPRRRPAFRVVRMDRRHRLECVDDMLDLDECTASRRRVMLAFVIMPGLHASPVGSSLLTERERVVLQYLPTMLTASEIAADLFVSVNTVKTHQRSIYRKLGVSSRRDAVDRARATQLI